MASVAVVTGAGSGVGAAVAISLLKAGWGVAVVGRRGPKLEETLAHAGTPINAMACPCDVGDEQAVQKMARSVLARWGTVHALINAAGMNVARRSLQTLSSEDYHRMVATNLHGAYYCTQAFLPPMRQSGTGTIVNIVSDAAKQASAKAGVSYVISKFGLAGLTQSINAEEQAHGIRACSIFPGDINTPLLDERPSPPPAESRQRMLQSEDIAECVRLVVSLPSRAVIEEILIRPPSSTSTPPSGG